ncbi:MAG: VCBS repeat-containing protein, partial [Candidatus Nanoarchaeia archaeon]
MIDIKNKITTPIKKELKKSITPVISVILLVLITIVASVSAFFFINSNVLGLESGVDINNNPITDNSRLNLVSITGSKAIVRNDGSSSVNEVIVFINGELFNYTLDSPIQPGELREINFNAQQAGEDLEIKLIYNRGKTVTKTSPANKNTEDSGYIIDYSPRVDSTSITQNATHLKGYCQASVYNASIESEYYYEWLLDDESYLNGSILGNHDNENYLLNIVEISDGSWNFKCLVGNGTYNSSWKTSSTTTIGDSGSDEPDNNLIYCLSNNSRNTWFSGSITGSNGACCGDDGFYDLFYNSTYSCNNGYTIFDDDNHFTYDYFGDKKRDYSGKNICELKGYEWMSHTLNFEDKIDYSVINDPQGITISDVNNDGWMDIISTNYQGSSVSVFLNDGDGNFSINNYNIGSNYHLDVATGDVNNDGWMDIVSNDWLNSQVDVLLNDGDGTFDNVRNDYLIGSYSTGLTLGDVNNDGWMDIIGTAAYLDKIVVRLNDGDGTFDNFNESYSVIDDPRSVAVGDVNNDGWIDIVSNNYLSHSVSLFLNDGDGTFETARRDYDVGSDQDSVTFGDFNNDDFLDILASDYLGNSMIVLLNNGSGDFQDNISSYSLGISPRDGVVGDFNNDGCLDFAGIHYNLSIRLGNCDGTFNSSII